MSEKSGFKSAAIAAAALILGGCLSDDSPDASGALIPQAPTGNNPPTITGAPPRAITVGRDYTFRPSAYDADADPLTFSAENLPDWATLNSANGAVTGLPSLGDIGMYRSITISVTDGSESDQLGPFDIEVFAPDPGNNAPTISGSPINQVTVNSNYSFLPTANDADGDALSFSAENLPPWASLNSSNGALSGRPALGDIGTYRGITISVTDGNDTDQLGPFQIEVIADGATLGSVTLSWGAPTENEDGSALTDLAGYRIYWGTQPGNYPNLVDPTNTGMTTTAGTNTFVVENLSVGTYYFVATAVDAEGTESGYSNFIAKVIQ